MTQLQLDRAVARATGEPLTLIRGLGFGPAPHRPADLEPEDLALRVECPFCGRHLPYPGVARGGSLALGECLACDVYFDVAPADVFAAPAPGS
jgi:hypothetical protein